MAARVLTRVYDDALRPYGLRTTQFSLLDLLESEGEMPIGRLAGRLATERTTITRDLAVLEPRGLVTSHPGRDRRQRLVAITRAGHDAVGAAHPAWSRIQSDVRSRLGEQFFDRIVDDLHTVTAQLSSARDY
jgi:DNA-binding MarR family transcriptional regulator